MKLHRILLLLAAALAGGVALGRLTAPRPQSSDAGSRALGAAAEFTCSMHPQIRQPNPGKCPICAMDLIPATRSGSGGLQEHEISLTPRAKALARIDTAPVQRRVPELELRLFGKIAADESRVRTIAARFPARIERLFVNYTGIRVNAGDHLARIYSPDLLTAQAELLGALRFKDERAARSAREKLALWGLTPRAIDEVAARDKPSNIMEIDAPMGGVVIEKLVSEGDYVETGAPLFRIADLSVVWVVLDAYERDKPWLRFGQRVVFSAEALPGQLFEGRIAFIPPILDPETRTFKVRMSLANPDLRLRPGMFVTGIAQVRAAGDGLVLDPALEGKWISPMHPEIVKDAPGACDVCGMALVPAAELGYATAPAEGQAPLVVPASAVLRTGRRAIVYVEVPGRAEPTYEGREVALGPRAGDVFIVLSGLEEGERVVVNGAFKIDSSAQLQAKPSMMSPGAKPDDPSSAGSQTGTSPRHPAPSPLHLDAPLAKAMLPPYLQLRAALAGEDENGARAALRSLMEIVSPEGAPAELIRQMLAADGLGGIRWPHFESLSEAMIASLKEHRDHIAPQLHLMFCPMVAEGRGARWLQESEEPGNPYFGSEMLLCGEEIDWDATPKAAR